MKEIYGSTIYSSLNRILITYYTLQENINTFEYYKKRIIGEDIILHHPDFIKAKDHIRQSEILLTNLYERNLQEDLINRVLYVKELE